MNHKYQVKIKNKVLKKLPKLPELVQTKLALLLLDLQNTGPIQPQWQNYSRLGNEKYHCHLGRSWVACWENKNNQLVIEVYYVGSRENAPY